MLQKKVTIIFLTTIFTLLLLAPILTPTVSTLDNTADSLKISVSTSPTRIQEGDNTTITIKIHQATPDKTYTFGINATNPAGNFSAINITITTNATGSGSISTEYWGDFTKANTNYVGTYFVAVKNTTTNETLATTSFTVGLTDKLKYARNETVMIKGSGYAANENVTINIKLKEMLVAEYLNITASAFGIVNYTWQIPENATPGTYTVSIVNSTASGTVKNPPDIQGFYVEVWTCQIWARNLTNKPLINLTIKVYNKTTVPIQFLNLSQLTNQTGWSSFMLATGNYTFKAFWKQVEVGNLLSNIKNDTVLEENWIQLSNLKMTVIDEATNEGLPFIQLRIEYNYTTEANETITETSYFETNLTGTVHIRNLFINISYIVEAKRYGLSLPPIQNKTFPSPWNTLTIKFPVYTASIHVVDSKNNPIKGVRVKAYEWSSGLRQSEITDPDGNVIFSLTFGKYRVKAYKDDVLLNETTIDLIRNQSSFIFRLATHNVDLNVAVLGYFGQPIPNALVKVVKVEQKTTVEDTTGPDGRVTFSGILGGDSRILIYIGGQLSGAKDLYLTDSKEVTFHLNRYVGIGGYAMETSQFVTAIALAILIGAFIVALTYKRLYKIFMKRK